MRKVLDIIRIILNIAIAILSIATIALILKDWRHLPRQKSQSAL